MRFGTRSEWREVGLELARVVTLANIVRGLGILGGFFAAVWVSKAYGALAGIAALAAVSGLGVWLGDLLEEDGWEALAWTLGLPILAVGLLASLALLPSVIASVGPGWVLACILLIVLIGRKR